MCLPLRKRKGRFILLIQAMFIPAASSTPVNNPPVAQPQNVTTAEDTAKVIVLVATDADGDTLTYSVVTQPAHGTVSGTSPNLTYTPNANYNGSDSFTFKANDTKLIASPTAK